MQYAMSLIYLGYTRNSGAVLYNSSTREFLDVTPAEVRRLIDRGQVKGILWKNGDDGPEFFCDKEGFNQQNIPVRTANKFRPYLNDVPGAPINSMYTVVRVLDTDYRGRLYEIVSNKCARVKVDENHLRELSKITNVAGVWITDGEDIRVCNDVMYEDRRPGATLTKGIYKDGVPVESLSQQQTESEETTNEQSETAAEQPEQSEQSGEDEDKAADQPEQAEQAAQSVEAAEQGEQPQETLASIFGNVENELAQQAAQIENVDVAGFGQDQAVQNSDEAEDTKAASNSSKKKNRKK